jgi:hypothetical protein
MVDHKGPGGEHVNTLNENIYSPPPPPRTIAEDEKA